MGRTVRLPFCPTAADVVAPEGWHVSRIVDSYEQLPTGQRYDSKTVEIDGDVPVLDQSQEGVLGHHSGDPGVFASLDAPVVTFANHTCAMRVLTTPFSVIQNVFPLIGRPGICDTRFLYYATKGRQSTEEYKGHHPAWRNSYFAYPDLEMQRRIVEILQPFDDLIENNRRRVEILEEMARSIYREWFVKFRYPGHEGVPLVDSALGPIPEGWVAGKVGQLCLRVQAGATPRRSTPEYWAEPSVDWYKTGDLTDGVLIGSSEKLSNAGLKAGRTFEPETILMAIYGSPTVGRLGLLTSLASANQAALGLVANPEVSTTEHLWFTLEILREHLNQIAQGAAQQNVSKEKVIGCDAIIPPREVLEDFTRRAAPSWRLSHELARQAVVLESLRDHLLPKLVTGEIDVSALNLDALLAEQVA